jgi:Flp pilus assembly protein TadG
MAVWRGILFAMGPIRTRISAVWIDQAGSAILEFALIAPAFVALLLATLNFLLIYVAQEMLETTAESAGRLLLTGTAQASTLTNGHVGMTADDFKNAICNGTTGVNARGETVTIPKLLPPMLTCSRLTVNVTVANTYNVAGTASPTFTYDSAGKITSTGTGYTAQSGGNGQNRILVLQIIYLWPTGTGPLGLDLTNQPNSNRMLVATSVFTTEDYSCDASQSSC